MKTKLFGFLFLAIVLGLGACKKDSNDSSSGSSVAKILSTAYYENGNLAFTQTIQYDASGKPVKVTADDGSFYYVAIGPSSVVITSFDTLGVQDGTDNYILNAKGLAISQVSTWNKPGNKNDMFKHHKNTGKGSSSYTYEYDANNYLIKNIYTEGGVGDTVIYTISGGNTTTATTVGSFPFVQSYQFLTNKTNTIGNENMGVSFLGKQDKNLISATTYTFDAGSQTINTSYTYDSKGRVLKVFNPDAPEDYTIYTYTN